MTVYNLLGGFLLLNRWSLEIKFLLKENVKMLRWSKDIVKKISSECNIIKLIKKVRDS